MSDRVRRERKKNERARERDAGHVILCIHMLACIRNDKDGTHGESVYKMEGDCGVGKLRHMVHFHHQIVSNIVVPKAMERCQ